MPRGMIHDIVLREPIGSTRDSEGRATVDYKNHAPTKGHMTIPDERVLLSLGDQTGETVDASALINKCFPVTKAWLLVVSGTGNPTLDGSYRIVGFAPNPWYTRVHLRRYRV